MGHVDAVTPTAFAVLLLSQATLASSQPTQTPRPFSAAEMLTAGQASQHTAIRYFVQANRHPRYVVSRNIPDHHVRRLMRHRRWRRIAACVSFGHPPVEANSSDVCGATNHSVRRTLPIARATRCCETAISAKQNQREFCGCPASNLRHQRVAQRERVPFSGRQIAASSPSRQLR
ncbi:hypothetical protein B0J12DRAFT_172411 [Macrophomina phaseolina]|uniref:Secreted protein n=1 Tax=Macrophomina phaseolina TaxID=35725 RepID=A0ABQ8GST3_9PEZI|nr:hypothetical protein B0J12DRAFT_172411 [Macrophomina phaseolina]